MKQISIIFLCFILAFACVGCAGGGDGESNNISRVQPSDNSTPEDQSDMSGNISTTISDSASTTDPSSTGTISNDATGQTGIAQNTTTKKPATKKPTTKTNNDGFKGTTYYVSSSTGNDWGEGTSESEPLKSLAVAATVGEPGDRVLFKRDDIWRGESMSLRSGVTYGAYGTGANPQFYGSAQNYSVKSKWKQTSNSRVWVYDEHFTQDIGGIVFDNGADYAVRQFKESDLNSKNEYYFGADRKVYLFSRNGNPADTYSSIEFIPDIMVMNSSNLTNVTVRDITFKYIGRNAFHATGTTKNLRIENCDFSWMGGVLWGPMQGETRLGNAITLWGSCYNVVVTNCKFNQIFDTAFTPQYSNSNCSEEIVFDNIEFSNNTVDNCHWSTEFWIDTKNSSGKRMGTIKNIKIINNVMRNAGGGWSANQRGTAGGLTSAGHIETFGNTHEVPTISNILIKGNVFDWSAGPLIALRWNNCTPMLEGNTYIQEKGKTFGVINGKEGTWKFDDAVAGKIKKYDPTAKVEFFK